MANRQTKRNRRNLKRALRPPAEPLTTGLFRRVIHRDGYRCHYCRKPGNLTLDHKVPRSAGGEKTFENSLAACRSCNTRKGNMSYSQFILLLTESRGL